MAIRSVYAKDDNNQAEDVFGNMVDVNDRKYNIVTPQFGVKYKFNANNYFNLNIGEYTRLPSFFELFGNQGFFRGSPDLKEESGVNADVGYTYSLFKPNSWLDGTRFYIGYFHNTIKNIIVRNTNAIGISVAENVAAAEINGLETSLKLYPLSQWTVLLNFNYLDSKNISAVPAFNSNRLPAQFEQDYNLHISYEIQQWVTGFSWDIKKGMFYDMANLLSATDVSDINLNILRKWKQHVFELKAENILNNQYENFRLQPTAGRTFYLTYTVRL